MSREMATQAFTEDRLASSKEPLSQLQSWWDERTNDPVVCLSTVGEYNDRPAPSCRLIELDMTPIHHDLGGIVFYTDSTSRKAKEFTANPNVALTLFFIETYRQIRIEGTVKILPKEYSTKYYNTLTRERQIVLLVGHQSQPIASRQALVDKKKDIEVKYAQCSSLPTPTNWEAYCVIPHKVEFFLSHEDWLADRIVFTKQEDTEEWTIERLMP